MAEADQGTQRNLEATTLGHEAGHVNRSHYLEFWLRDASVILSARSFGNLGLDQIIIG